VKAIREQAQKEMEHSLNSELER